MTDQTSGPINDMPQLYALQHAIRDAGGTLTPRVHKAIDALREAWDAGLRQAQQHAGADLLPAWEAVYEPGNVSDYLIGYANDECAAKAAAEAWFRSQRLDEPGQLEWIREPSLHAASEYDQWFELIEDEGDGIRVGHGLIVRHRMAAVSAPVQPTVRADVYAEVAEIVRSMAPEHPRNASWVQDCHHIADRIDERRAELRRMAGESSPVQTPEICELPHLTIAEEDACEARRVAGEEQPATETQRTVRCSAATFKRPHGPHPWKPQPGMEPVRCPGACKCDHAHTEHSPYGCVDDCACEYLPLRQPAVVARQDGATT